MFDVESQAPELFEIPELAHFYRFLFKKGNGEYAPRKPQRNDPCVCGSGKKQKRCCGEFENHKYRRLIDLILSESLKEDKQDDNKNKQQEGAYIKWLLHP